MSLIPIDQAARARRFIVYDLEWIPGTLKLRVCGVYDGKRFRRYLSIADFIIGEMVSRQRGAWFYAHFGGGADLQFVVNEIWQRWPDIEVNGSFSGSSLIIAHIKRGHHVWHFLDSYWLLRASLDEIGEALGMPKTGPDKTLWTREQVKQWYATVSDAELFEYNEQDCRVLWHAIDQFETTVLARGGQLQMTLASTAMTLFRRQYLGQEIPTSDAVNDIARGAYAASRVEVFAKDCDSGWYYDVNSSFPYAMTHPLPGAFLRTHTKLTDRLLRDDCPSLVYAKVTVPEQYLPPLPYRDGATHRIYFPVGTWQGWFTNVDIALLLETGGTVHRAREVLEFEPFHDMTNYVMDLYSARKAATSDFESTTLKLLLNTLYGKTAERPDKSKLVINPGPKLLEQLQAPDRDCPVCRGRGKAKGKAGDCPCRMRNYRAPGLWVQHTMADVPHAHVPIAAHVTAIARRTLFNFLGQSSEVYYCDTDGFAASDTYAESNELGALKLEKIVYDGLFIAPKVYRLNADVKKKGNWQRKTILKAKGFSLPKQPEEAQKYFSRLADGLEVQVERMIRIRENLRRGNLTPREDTIPKHIKNPEPKRYFYPDGSSRPWDVVEIK